MQFGWFALYNQAEPFSCSGLCDALNITRRPRGEKNVQTVDEEGNVNIFIKTSLVLAAIAGISVATATAQDNRSGRYTMHKTDDGLVRLDTETGAVSLCQKIEKDWRCQPMAGTPTSAPGELASLRRENAELKAEIKRMEDNLGLNGNRDKSTSNKRNFKLPSEQEVDQALNYFERMLRKFQDRLKRLEQRPATPERQL